MVAPAAGSVVLVPFPYSDLSESKLRPAIALADAGRGDWVLCQVTSNPYGDARALPVASVDLASGTMRVASFVRPGKLFTAHRSLLVAEVGKLKRDALQRVLDAVVAIIRAT